MPGALEKRSARVLQNDGAFDAISVGWSHTVMKEIQRRQTGSGWAVLEVAIVQWASSQSCRTL